MYARDKMGIGYAGRAMESPMSMLLKYEDILVIPYSSQISK